MDKKRALYRITGNFGIAFFSPLVGGNVSDTVFNIDISFTQLMIISLLSALLTTGLAISKEVAEFGKKW